MRETASDNASAAGQPRELLAAAARELEIELPDDALERLGEHLKLIAKWNRVYNLTAVRDAGDMLTQHTVDSLSVVGPLRRHTAGRPVRLLDVGSGAGLPGVVIAICCPEVQVECVDTVAKKATFIRQVALELGLPNLRAVHARVENLRGPYDVITARAFASLGDLVRLSAGALVPRGVWMALKGKHPQAELDKLPPEVAVFHVEQLTVPGLDAERCIVWLRRLSPIT